MGDELDGRTESELVTRYTYDSFNRLLRYSDHDGSTCYSYNADGYRTAKYDYADSAEGTRYLSIGGRNLFETSCAGSFTALNTYGTTLTSRASLAGGYEYRNIVYLYSAYGDVVLVADAQTGMKFASYAYDPFGNAILARTPDTSVEISESSGESSDITVTSGTESSAFIDNPYGYRGYVKDDESGLYYLNARYYDSASGRFLTADTFRGSKDDPLSLNRYVYCQSNPVRYTDPSGHFALFAATAIAGGVIGAVVGGVKAYKEGKSGWDVVKSVAVGAGVGAVAGAAVGLGAGAAVASTMTGATASTVSTGLAYCAGYTFVSANGTAVAATAVGAVAVVGGAGTAVQGAVDIKNGIESGDGDQIAYGALEVVGGGLMVAVGAQTTYQGGKAVSNNQKSQNITADNTSKKGDKSSDIPNASKRQTPDQSALYKLAKEAEKNAKNGNPISYDEAKILDEWAKEYNVPQHHPAEVGSGQHFPGGNYMDHTHIYNIHVPYKY